MFSSTRKGADAGHRSFCRRPGPRRRRFAAGDAVWPVPLSRKTVRRQLAVLASGSAAMKELATPIGTRSVAASTIGRRIRTSRFDDENGRCSGFEVRRRCRSSAQFTPRSTTISISRPRRRRGSLRDGGPRSFFRCRRASLPCSSVSRAMPYQRSCRSDAVRRELVSDGLRSLVTGRNTGRGDKTGLSCHPMRQENRGFQRLSNRTPYLT